MHKAKIVGQLNFVNPLAIFINTPHTPTRGVEMWDIRSISLHQDQILKIYPYMNIRELHTKFVELKFETEHPISFSDDALYCFTPSNRIISLQVVDR